MNALAEHLKNRRDQRPTKQKKDQYIRNMNRVPTKFQNSLLYDYVPDKLPSPPANLYLSRVTHSRIMVQWSDPMSHPEKADRYVLRYRRQGDDQYTEVGEQ